MKSRIFSYFFTIIFVLIQSFLTWQNVIAEANTGKTKIGVIVALTGPPSTVGVNIKNSIILAAEKANSSKDIEFIFEDDQFQAKNAVNAAEKLINNDKVSALITFSGNISAAVSKIAEQRHIPMIGITALSTIGTSKEYVYSLFLDSPQQISVLSDAVTKLKAKRIGVVTTTQDALLGIRKQFVEKNKEAIVRDEEVLPGDADLNTIATKVLSEKPDVIALFTLPPQTSIFSKYFRGQGFTGKFLGGPPMFNPPEIKAAQNTLTGSLIAAPKGAAFDAYLGDYLEKYKEPCVSEGMYGYDSAMMMIQAIKSGDIHHYLNSLKTYSGIAGEYPKDINNAFGVPAEMKSIRADAQLESWDLG